MTSRDTTPAGTANANLRRTRAALCLTTAIAALAIPASSFATAVTVGGTDVNTANTAIVTATTAPNLDVTVNAALVQPGNPLVLGYIGSGLGDGAITFLNSSTIGTVALPVSVNINAASGTVPGNSAVVTNTGLITGSLTVGGFLRFTGGATVNNTGTGTINGSLYVGTFSTGALVYLQDAGAKVLGSITLENNRRSSSATAAGITTTTFTGSDVTATINGDVGTLLTPGDVLVNPTTNTVGGTQTVTVNGIAGNVAVALTQSSSKTVSGSNPVPVGAGSWISNQSDTYGSTSTGAVTIGTTGNVKSVALASGSGGSTVKISGKVGGAIGGSGDVSSTSTSVDSLSTTTSTQTAGLVVTGVTTVASNTSKGGASLVTIDAGAAVAGSVTSTGDKSATVAVSGSVNGNITATSQATNDTSSVTDTYDTATGLIHLSNAQTGTAAASGGAALVTVAAGSKVGGTVDVIGDTGAVLTKRGYSPRRRHLPVLLSQLPSLPRLTPRLLSPELRSVARR
jgi:hypothetical protein